jgi:hypothetical protein
VLKSISDACHGKQAYKTFNDAKGNIASLGGNSYKCPACGLWHVASKKPKPKMSYRDEKRTKNRIDMEEEE